MDPQQGLPVPAVQGGAGTGQAPAAPAPPTVSTFGSYSVILPSTIPAISMQGPAAQVGGTQGAAIPAILPAVAAPYPSSNRPAAAVLTMQPFNTWAMPVAAVSMPAMASPAIQSPTFALQLPPLSGGAVCTPPPAMNGAGAASGSAVDGSGGSMDSSDLLDRLSTYIQELGGQELEEG